MSGEMIAFLCFMVFFAVFMITPLIFPVGFKATWDTIWLTFGEIFFWALSGWSGEILIIAYCVVGGFLTLYAGYMVLDRLYNIGKRIIQAVS